MILNSTNLTQLHTAFNAAFMQGLPLADSQWNRVAMTVPSTTAEEEYGWLADFPIVREWLGDRQIQNLRTEGFKIRNRSFEETVGVPVPAIEDDRFGIYAPRFTMMGQSAANFPNKLVFDLLAASFATACWDGQYFIDTDHPVVDAAGAVQSVSNSGGGSGTAWFLLDLSQVIKPIIYQDRKRMDMLVIKDDPKDDRRFMKNEIVYGVDGRMNVGYGLWQLAYGSKSTLNDTNYAAARAAMQGFYGNGGVKLGIRPTHLVVPSSLESAARAVVSVSNLSGGATNPWFGTAELVVCPWL